MISVDFCRKKSINLRQLRLGIMAESVVIQVLNRIRLNHRGKIFFVESFIDISNAKSVNKALERLVKSGEISRLAQGIYVRPVFDDLIGEIVPSIEEVARAIAKRDRAIIQPVGNFAMYKLGLTTQVPLNIVFITNSSAREIKIGKQVIVFKKASSRSLAFIGKTSSLAIQALRALGKDQIEFSQLEHLRQLLKKENPKDLKHDLTLAPVWIRNLLTSNE